jgi:pyruvate,water dikinase
MEREMLENSYDLSFYEFDKEKDPNSYGVLLCDVVHGRPLKKPLYIEIGWFWYYHGFRYASETLSLPTTHGWDSRFIKGYPYITAIRTTEEERKAREPIFREKIRPYLKDFRGCWERDRNDLMKMYKDAKTSRGLKEWEDIKRLSNIELLSFFLDFAFSMNRKEGEIHMMNMVPANYINGTFQQMWKELFGVEPSVDPDFSNLMAGSEEDIADVWVVKKLWQLGKRAIELGLGKAFEVKEDEGVIEELQKSNLGSEWLDEYRDFLSEHGWRCESMHAYDTPAWVEKPGLAIKQIKMMLHEDDLPVDAKRDQRIKERKRLEDELPKKVPQPQRETFKVMAKASQWATYYSEDHTYYCDLYIGAIGRWIVSEFGRRFAEAGCIDDPNDIHFLHINEIRKAAIPMGKVNLRPYVQRRKGVWEENLTIEPRPCYGDMNKAQEVLISDPTLQVSTQMPLVRKELKADLYGAASAPGIAEGVARVIMNAGQLPELKPGEILIAPGTSTEWTVAFGIIKGLVSDGGSALSHPVIMSREYGIPCVAGCLEGTTKIKTGTKVRVDGNQGVVYILG